MLEGASARTQSTKQQKTATICDKLRSRDSVSQMALQRCNVNFLARFLVEFWKGEFLEGEFFRGPLLLEKTVSKIRPKNSGPKFGRPKFVSQNSALDSDSGGAKSPVQTFVPETLAIFSHKTKKNKKPA